MTADPRFHPRRTPDDRPYPRPPMRPGAPPGRAGPETLPPTSVRLRDGEREIEVSGSPGFVRQILDELPALIARLRGEAAPTPASIRMPSPAPAGDLPPAGLPRVARTGDGRATAPAVHPGAPGAEPAPGENGPARSGGPGEAGGSLEDRVMAALRSASHPLPVATIRGRLGGGVSAQQVRRILERAGSRVVVTGDRPIRYRLR